MRLLVGVCALNSNAAFFEELDVCCRSQKACVDLGDGRGFVINDHEMVEHILVRKHRNYFKGPEFDRVKLLTGAGLIVIDGEDWRTHRQLMRPSFSKSSFLFFKEIIQDETKTLCSNWLEAASQNKQIDLVSEVSQYSLNIILKCIFSSDLDKFKTEAHRSPFDIFVENTNRDIDMARSVWQLRKQINEVVEQRRNSTESYDDMLDTMLNAKLRDGRQFSNKNLVDEIVTLIVAGHETSAITLSWMWLLLSLNPDVEIKLRSLCDKSSSSAPKIGNSTDDANQYIEQVMAETLRLYPPVWMFSRKAMVDDSWNDIQIPKNSTVFISPYYLQRSSERWDKPDEFIPERFNGSSLRETRESSYIPFSAGPRRCIGDNLSLMEAHILFTEIMPKLKLNSENDYKIAVEPAVNLRSAKPITMKIEAI